MLTALRHSCAHAQFSLGSRDGMDVWECFQLHQGRCGLDIKKDLFTERVVKNQNRLFREVVDVPSLTVLKKYLDNAFN